LQPSFPISKSEAPKTRADLVVREATSDEDIIGIHKLLMTVKDEVVLVPANPVKVMEDVYRVVQNADPDHPCCALIAVRDGEVVGTLAFTEVCPKYSDHTILLDDWFQVHPDHRNGSVGPALLNEARAIADAAGKILLVATVNPARRRGRVEKIATFLRYEPSGAMLAFKPKE
jgi:GNAT superfamily N-acetyltransferase